MFHVKRFSVNSIFLSKVPEYQVFNCRLNVNYQQLSVDCQNFEENQGYSK
jgi:hypothetical protein